MKKKRIFISVGIILTFVLFASFIKLDCSQCDNGTQIEKNDCSTCKGKGEYRCEGVMQWDGGLFYADFTTPCDGGKHYNKWDGSHVLDCPGCIGGITSCDDCSGYGYSTYRRDCRKCDGYGENTLFGIWFD